MHYAWIILICCFFIETGSLGAVYNCLGIYLTPICTDFHASATSFSLYLTLQSIAMAIVMFFAGRLYTKFGIKKVILFATPIQSILLILLSFSHSLIPFYISAFLIGPALGLIGILPVPMLLTNWFSKFQGFAIGIAMACVGISGAAFNIIYSNLFGIIGWRGCFFLMGGISFILIFPCTLFFLKNTPLDKNCLPYGQNNSSMAENKLANSSAVSGISAKGIFKFPVFWLSMLLAGSAGYASVFISYLPAHGINIGLSTVASGALASGSMIGNMLGAIFLGIIADKTSEKIASCVAVSLILVSIVGICLAQNNLMILLPSAVLFGISMSIPNALIPIIIKKIFGLKDYETIFPYFGSCISFVVAVTFILAGFLFDVTHTYVIGFVSAGIALLSFLFLTLWTLRKNYF